MSRRERGYVIAVVVLLVVLVIKSLVFDPVKLEEASELRFESWVEQKLDEKYDNFLFDYNLVVHRLVSVKEKKEEEEELLYVGKVRRYLLGVVPFSEQYIKEKKSDFE